MLSGWVDARNTHKPRAAVQSCFLTWTTTTTQKCISILGCMGQKTRTEKRGFFICILSLNLFYYSTIQWKQHGPWTYINCLGYSGSKSLFQCWEITRCARGWLTVQQTFYFFSWVLSYTTFLLYMFEMCAQCLQSWRRTKNRSKKKKKKKRALDRDFYKIQSTLLPVKVTSTSRLALIPILPPI